MVAPLIGFLCGGSHDEVELLGAVIIIVSRWGFIIMPLSVPSTHQDRSPINTRCMAQGARGIMTLHIQQSNPKLMKRAFMRCKYLRFYFVSQVYIYKDTGSDLDVFDVFILDYSKFLLDSLPLRVPMCLVSVFACLLVRLSFICMYVYICM